ncbi:MAG: ABC transporter ATP-binding protein [Opitutales bacterium]
MRRDDRRLRKDEFWAVENLSLRIMPGESLALVGRNGAGKSTLLKLVAGLLKPDSGRITIRGRMQSLINLGAGFNPRLSGRENILNAGAVQGFSSREMKSVEAAVIDFAEIEEFIDSPVHTYSSGMRARLGYSIAVHLDPDILLLDEVLSVGDFLFQNKCHYRMQELRSRGVTTISVSHSHSRLLQSCNQALWINRGRKIKYGNPQEVIRAYLEETSAESETAKRNSLESAEGVFGLVHQEHTLIRDVHANIPGQLDSPQEPLFSEDDSLNVAFGFELVKPTTQLALSWVLFRADGLRISLMSSRETRTVPLECEGKVEGALSLRRLGLAPGGYALVLCVNDGESLMYRDVIFRFSVYGDPCPGRGPLRPDFSLTVAPKTAAEVHV